MQEWASMLAIGFRLQSYRAEGPWVQRFRQLLAHEIEALGREPLALVSVSPAAALLSSPVTIKPASRSEVELASPEEATISGVCRTAARVTINGEPVEVRPGDGHAAFSQSIALQPGRNLVEIEVTAPDGATSTLYRELLRVPDEG